MTQWKLTFEDKDGTIIIEKRLHNLNDRPIKNIAEAVDLGYTLAQERNWKLEAVEQL